MRLYGLKSTIIASEGPNWVFQKVKEPIRTYHTHYIDVVEEPKPIEYPKCRHTPELLSGPFLHFKCKNCGVKIEAAHWKELR